MTTHGQGAQRTWVRGFMVSVSSLAIAGSAAAQAPAVVSPPLSHCLACAVPAGVRREAAGIPRLFVAIDIYSAPSAEDVIPRRVRGAIFGAVWGLLAGTAVGFVVGQHVEKKCGPDGGPCFRGLGGAVVGAGVGFVLGGVIGFLVTDEEAPPAR